MRSILRLFKMKSTLVNFKKGSENQTLIALPDIEMIREAILYRTKNAKAKTVMISNTIGITSTNVFKTAVQIAEVDCFRSSISPRK